jgi:hypothetical protein
MRDRRDDERSFRGPMGMGREGRDEDRFRDRDRDRDWERDRTWRRDENMGGAQWSGASGRGGYESRFDFDDRPRNLGARDYETRHFYGGRGGFDRSYERGYDPSGPGRSFDPGGDYHRVDLADIEDRGPHYGKGPKGYKRSDERMREDVCDCIARQGHIDASDVEVKVENGVVSLTGTVGQRHHKRVLEQMVERVHGVQDVRNELRLQRDEPTQARVQQSGQQNGDQTRQSQMPNGKNARA